MKRSVLCVLVVLVAAAAPGSAAENGFFIGAGIGESTLDYRDYDSSLERRYVNGSTWGFKALGGYRLMKYFALEGGYIDFGDPEWIEANAQGYRLKLQAHVTGWNALAVGILPVGGVEFFAKAGVIAWESNFRIIRDEDVETDSESGTDAAYGIGFAVSAGKGATLRFEAERFNISAGEAINFYSVGVLYTF